MSTPVLHNKSLFEMLFGTYPLLTHLQIFGCACFPLLKPYNTTKLQAQITKCVFLGYVRYYEGCLCYHVRTKRMFISMHVIFDEQNFPCTDLVSMRFPLFHLLYFIPIWVLLCLVLLHTTSLCLYFHILPFHLPHLMFLHQCPSLLLLLLYLLVLNPLLLPFQPFYSIIVASTLNSHSRSIPPEFAPGILQVVLSIPHLNLHPKSMIVKKKALLTTVQDSGALDLSLIEPMSYKSPLKVPI